MQITRYIASCFFKSKSHFLVTLFFPARSVLAWMNHSDASFRIRNNNDLWRSSSLGLWFLGGEFSRSAASGACHQCWTQEHHSGQYQEPLNSTANSEVYGIVSDGWRGDYHSVSETCIYQGPAVASTRTRALFVIYGHDKRGAARHLRADVECLSGQERGPMKDRPAGLQIQA
jgi:hypothetical protein